MPPPDAAAAPTTSPRSSLSVFTLEGGAKRQGDLRETRRARRPGRRAAHSRENGPAEWANHDPLKPAQLQGSSACERPVAHSHDVTRSTHSCFCDHYQAEIDHLGIARSPAFHYEPETNGCAEKAIQILKEQLLWIERFETLDELRTAVRRFGRAYNQHWLIERHGYRTPTEAREHLRAQAAARA
jgi:Integrase core domain